MQVTSCCGCCSTRAGAIIVAILELIFAISMLIFACHSNTKTQVGESDADPDLRRIIYIAISCKLILLGILLLVGILKRNTCMMLPWLVLVAIGTVLQLFDIIVTSAIFFANNVPVLGTPILIVGLLAFALAAYLWLVVYSYYKQLKSEEMNGRIGLYEKSPKYQDA